MESYIFAPRESVVATHPREPCLQQVPTPARCMRQRGQGVDSTPCLYTAGCTQEHLVDWESQSSFPTLWLYSVASYKPLFGRWRYHVRHRQRPPKRMTIPLHAQQPSGHTTTHCLAGTTSVRYRVKRAVCLEQKPVISARQHAEQAAVFFPSERPPFPFNQAGVGQSQRRRRGAWVPKGGRELPNNWCPNRSVNGSTDATAE